MLTTAGPSVETVIRKLTTAPPLAESIVYRIQRAVLKTFQPFQRNSAQGNPWIGKAVATNDHVIESCN